MYSMFGQASRSYGSISKCGFFSELKGDSCLTECDSYKCTNPYDDPNIPSARQVVLRISLVVTSCISSPAHNVIVYRQEDTIPFLYPSRTMTLTILGHPRTPITHRYIGYPSNNTKV